MNKIIFNLIVITCLLVTIVSNAGAYVIGFEDLHTPDGVNKLDMSINDNNLGYRGFQWDETIKDSSGADQPCTVTLTENCRDDNFMYLEYTNDENESFIGSPFYNDDFDDHIVKNLGNRTSYISYSANSLHFTVTLTRTELFDFTGAYFTTLMFSNETSSYSSFSAHGITVEGYRDGVFIDSASILDTDPGDSGSPDGIPIGEFEWMQADILNINELRFISQTQGFPEQGVWLMDNLTINESGNNDSGNNVVPEPSTLLLFGIGLMGFIVYREKKVKL